MQVCLIYTGSTYNGNWDYNFYWLNNVIKCNYLAMAVLALPNAIVNQISRLYEANSCQLPTTKIGGETNKKLQMLGH